MIRKIYVASSWRNIAKHSLVCDALLADGHQIYDFTDPYQGAGFNWEQLEPNYKTWSKEEYVTALEEPLAVKAFASDFGAMKWADTCVLVNPCGRSAHLELGWCAGAGKQTFVLLDEKYEPELMVKMADKIYCDLNSLILGLRSRREWGGAK